MIYISLFLVFSDVLTLLNALGLLPRSRFGHETMESRNDLNKLEIIPPLFASFNRFKRFLIDNIRDNLSLIEREYQFALY